MIFSGGTDSSGGMNIAGGNGASQLRLEPFRAIRYAHHHSLPRVTSPPYDVVGADGVAALEAADPHNIVRLILPHDVVGVGDDSPYHRAADSLRRWHDSGILITDSRAALWVYRHTTVSGMAVGLVGTVGVDGPIHPHESTFDGPVADRAALMTATDAQLEPILLTYHGDGDASDVVDAALAANPEISVVVEDGSRHELWRLDDPSAHARVATDLASREALIADGHHRFSAYRRVHAAERRAATATGLAVLVDASRHPLVLRGVHRVIAGLSMDDAVDRALTAGLATLDDDSGGPTSHATFTLTDGRMTTRIRATDAAYRTARGGEPDRPVVDAAVLKYALIENAWAVDDAGRRVSYVHTEAEASTLARHHGGVAVLVAPPRLDDVMQTAQAGATMPQKSTSFGPKPRTGLLMRWTH